MNIFVSFWMVDLKLNSLRIRKVWIFGKICRPYFKRWNLTKETKFEIFCLRNFRKFAKIDSKFRLPGQFSTRKNMATKIFQKFSKIFVIFSKKSLRWTNDLGFELVSGLVLGLLSLAQNHYLIGSGLFFKPQKSVLE